MKSYRQYCPIARGAEVFATRWTPVIVRNLLLGCRTYTELLDGAPGIPRSLLSERLRQMQSMGIVDRVANPDGRGWRYEPTQACLDLRPVCEALGAWGGTYVELSPEHLDPYVGLWAIARGLGSVDLPESRINARFDFPLLRTDRHRFWLLVQRPEPEVCVQHPGYDEDLVIQADPEWLALWVLGQSSLGRGMRTGKVTVEGPRAVTRELARLGTESVAALGRWGEPAST